MPYLYCSKVGLHLYRTFHLFIDFDTRRFKQSGFAWKALTKKSAEISADFFNSSTGKVHKA
jgi:hypothetical protein